MTTAIPQVAAAYEHWLARLDMTFKARQGKTRLVDTKREGPLSVQRAFYPERSGAAHLYLLHPPAGIVSGDELNIAANLDTDCEVLLTTPGANRFYRARDAVGIASKQSQHNRFYVQDNARLEYLPHETLVYANANAFSTTDIFVEGNASFVGWDIACLGLPHIQQPFDKGRFTQTLSLYHNGRIRFHDRLAVEAQDDMCRSRIGLAGHHVVGNMVLFNGEHAASTAMAKQLVELARNASEAEHENGELAITQLQGVVITRYLGDDSEACRECFARIWAATRPLMSGRDAVPPRIWYT
ncbi:urease accessory protein UreD [Alteromonas confluentis]|uniref:Urease accessory protein UreD n=1 Tax=Alteromonas confluentis TaxID=1656094 RepID=A0A1E7ZA12_9ALTE|nr:urease accessory protein UreD [Alteromonas confluentis]OFC70383.1 hypothetical protein BFC18_14545 [Alteromonas confluentis]